MRKPRAPALAAAAFIAGAALLLFVGHARAEPDDPDNPLPGDPLGYHPSSTSAPLPSPEIRHGPPEHGPSAPPGFSLPPTFNPYTPNNPGVPYNPHNLDVPYNPNTRYHP